MHTQRKGKEKDPNPQPTDLAEKLMALKRRTAAATRPKDKAEREPPTVMHEEFDRRLKISSQRREPEVSSDATGSSAARPTRQGHLFDHRKDDPIRFQVMPRPSKRPGPVADHVSASSTSSYAHSISSSTFTLSSTTDGSSASSALFDAAGSKPNHQGTEDSGNNVFSQQLKRLYRALTALETKIKQQDSDEGEEPGRSVILKGKEAEVLDKEKEKDKWNKRIHDHKELAEIIHNLLEMSLSPSVPASLRNIPTKYNIIVRLWTFGFHKLLESLRRASFGSPLALEHLQDFIYYAYTFYTGLLEEPTLASFRSGWLEALGDLARYRMAVCSMVPGAGGPAGTRLTTEAVSQSVAETSSLSTSGDANAIANVNANAKKHSSSSDGSNSQASFPARIDDSPSPSIGPAAARLMVLEPEKELWRMIARDWYGWGLAEQPGTGKLHHHLGLLAREVEGEELRGVYHFVKSMTTLHPFMTSRESILQLFSSPQSPAAVAAPPKPTSAPKSRTKDLFVQLHGMLFTHIQLDDFAPTLEVFLERLESNETREPSPQRELEERDWIMMAVVNVGAILEYGRDGVVRKLGGLGGGASQQPGQAGHHHHAGQMGVGVGGQIPAGGQQMMMMQRQQQQQQAAMRVMAKKVAAGVPGSMMPAGGEEMDVDVDMDMGMGMDGGHPEGPTLPLPLTLALTLTMRMLEIVLRRPTRQATPFALAGLNPYLTTVLTFLATVCKQGSGQGGGGGGLWAALDVERYVPWEELVLFLGGMPGRVGRGQLGWGEGDRERERERDGAGRGREKERERGEKWTMLTSGCSPPLPEDWCMRGMEWVGRRVFERGYWTSKGGGGSGEEDKRAEMEVLDAKDGGGDEDGTDGRIEDDDGDESGSGDGVGGAGLYVRSRSHGKRRRSGAFGPSDSGGGGVVAMSKGTTGGAGTGMGTNELVRRWVRVVRCAIVLEGVVDGFEYCAERREWGVEGRLRERVEGLKEEERRAREEKERERRGTRRGGEEEEELMDVDDEEEEESSEESEDDSQEVKDLRARRRYLKALLAQQRAVPVSAAASSSTPRRRAPRKRTSTRDRDAHPSLNIQPYYTTLILDTNVLLTSLPALQSLISKHLFTIIVPLPVVTELDGLSSSSGANASTSPEAAPPSSSTELREAAQAALEYINTAVRTHGMVVKVQTTRGNYLSSLSVRVEDVDFAGMSLDSSGGANASSNGANPASLNNMDDLILKVALWQDEHWVDREGLLKSGLVMPVEVPEVVDKQSAAKVVLVSLDRNLRLKARARQLPAASEKDLAKILGMAVAT